MDLWNLQIPAPLALAVIAAFGYLISVWKHQSSSDIVVRSRRELKRAQMVASELEKISWAVRQSLAEHHSSVARFKDRVGRLSDRQEETVWRELCREAEEILKPTLQLATQIASAYDEIRQQSANLMAFTEVRTDPLTGVNNRRGLDDALCGQLAMMNRYNSVFSLVMFDIDHFKQINDQEGHLYGDHVLQELARLFDESIRETDIVSRYGGEEFVIVMPQTDLDGASVFADRLRANVADKLDITISGGVTEAVGQDAPESLIARADAALYNAKTDGRNRVFRHNGDDTELVAEEELPENLIQEAVLNH